MMNFANPTVFVDLTRRLLPWLAAATAALFVVGLWLSFAAPPDYQQGETVKIMYLHVPAAWMATFVYGVMTAAALGTLVGATRWPMRRRRRRRRSARDSPSSVSPPARCGASRCGGPTGYGTRA